MPNDTPSPHEIFEGWSLFECVIAHNYMRHAEMVEALAACAELSRAPIRVLDVGCGDAYLASEGLKRAKVASYVGIDLSQAALQRARERMASIASYVDVREGDLRAVLDEPMETPPNLMIASFALHHYPLEEQRDLVSKCYRLLASGDLVWIDLRCGDAETREDYLKRFFEALLPNWTELEPGQVSEVMAHMNEADFPVSDNEKLAMAASAGFIDSELLYADDYYAAHRFNKA